MIIDDNNYLNGKYVPFNPQIPYIIVFGARAIGKSQYSKAMSVYNSNVQYYSVQRLFELPIYFINNAKKIINISEVAII